MTFKIIALRKKEMPSKFGDRPWFLTEVKLEGQGDKTFTLKGYGRDKIEKGSIVKGYLSTRKYQSQNGTGIAHELNKITAEYLYDLILKKFPDIENVQNQQNADSEPDFEEPEIENSDW